MPDGVADYTHQLGNALKAAGASVQVGFSSDLNRQLLDWRAAPVDWLILQYSPFAWGRYGLNGGLLILIRKLKRLGIRVALMVHEPYLPWGGVKTTVLSFAQRLQLFLLMNTCDQVFVSIEEWTKRLKPWVLGHSSRLTQSVLHLPVGSTIPSQSQDREKARQHFGVQPNEIAVGFFGSHHPSRLRGWVDQTVAHLNQEGIAVHYLGVGAQLPLGVLPPDEVDQFFCALDLYLCPYLDGVSTRRTSFMAGLHHRVATLSTDGFLTDPLLRQYANRAFVLTPADHPDAYAQEALKLCRDSHRRAEIAREGQALYEKEFNWSVIARKIIERLHCQIL